MKNVFLREIKKYRKSLLFWCIGLIVLIGSSMAKFSVFQGDSNALTGLMKQLPQSLQTVFGLTGFDLTTAEGFYGVTFLYISLMVAVHAVLLGANILAKEERERTSEFLFVKPISRSKIISAKIFAGIFELLVINIVTFVSSIWIVDYLNKGASITGKIAILMLGLIILQLVFFFIGMAIAAVSRRPKASASVATSVLLIAFVIQYLVNMNKDLNWLKYFSPFKYFDAHNLLSSGSLDGAYVTISAVIIGVAIFITYLVFNKRDLDV